MKFINTNGGPETANFQEALFAGEAPNGGLWLPGAIPWFSPKQIIAMRYMNYAEIALEILWPHLSDVMTKDELKSIVDSCYDPSIMPIRLDKVGGRYILRLDQGPTLAFKDWGMRFNIQLMNHFLKKMGIKLVILGATTGDTGGAGCSAAEGNENIICVVIYKKNKPNAEQRRMMTTCDNTIAIEVEDGSFDVCQALMKAVKSNKELSKRIAGHENLFATMNSISVGRLMAQVVYPFWAHSRLPEGSVMIPVIPSGNLGDFAGTLIAREMGLPIKVIIVAQNKNCIFDDFYRTAIYAPKEAVDTPSRSMDIGAPNNLPRIIFIQGGLMSNGEVVSLPDMDAFRNDFRSFVLDNAGHAVVINSVYQRYNYMLDPHAAVAWAAWDEFAEELESLGTPVLYQTAHEGKFPDEIKEFTDVELKVPEIIQKQAKMPERIFSITAPADEVEVGEKDKVKVASQGQLDQLVEILCCEVSARL